MKYLDIYILQSAPIGEWMCYFSPLEIMTDLATDRPNDQQIDMKGHREVGLSIMYDMVKTNRAATRAS